jgi:methyl-accepting chemotaxis protein
VKELARDTATATESIATFAGRIQSGTSGALASMSKMSGVIEKINQYTTSIAAAVEQQAPTTAQTRNSFAEAADGANNIANAVHELAGRQ